MSEAKPTPGPWHVANGVQIRGEREQIAKVWMMRGGEGKANASLIAEAGTVRGETGLTPRQLVERVKELERALGDYMSAFGQALEAHGILFAQQQICADEMARAALAKCQEVKP